MGVDADLHAEATPRDAMDEPGESPAVEEESYEDGGGYEEESGEETEAAGAATGAASEALDDAGGFEVERAWSVFCETLAHALDAESTDEFLARVLGAIAHSARALGNDAAHATTVLANALGV